jgi:hypothetical protein
MGGPMHRSQPNRRSEASPRICALECQKTFLPSGCSKGSSSKRQLLSSGRSRSHNVSLSVPLSIRAITVRSNKLFAMPRAISAGLVTHDSPIMILPSSRVMSIFSRGFWAMSSSYLAFSFSLCIRKYGMNLGRCG